MQRRSDMCAAEELFGGEQRHRVNLPRLKATYAWMPPFEGASLTSPNRLEVVFSRHRRVSLQQAGKVYDVDVAAGGFYVIGEEPTTLLNVPEFSDTLELYPDMDLLTATATACGKQAVVLRPTLDRREKGRFVVDGVMLAVAHLLRRVCLRQLSLSAIEASALEHIVAEHAIGLTDCVRGFGRLSPRTLQRVVDLVEDELELPLTLDELASEACLSVSHFARSFKNSTGLAPHQYVLARRIERTKQLLMTSDRSVEDIATSLGFENLYHFRRQFHAQMGVLPGELRAVARHRKSKKEQDSSLREGMISA